MSGSSPQTTTQNASSQTGPWQPSQGILQGILNKAGGVNTDLTKLQKQGIAGLGQAAQGAQQYMPDINNQIANLFGGGNFGHGDTGIANALSQTNANLSPYASGAYLDPYKDPAFAQSIQTLMDDANNNIGGAFSAARGGPASSPGAMQAISRGFAQGAAPALVQQYQANQNLMQNANQALNSNAQGAAGAYNNTAAGQLGAQLQAPGAISNLGLPASMLLGAGGANEQTQLGNLGMLSNLLLPIAGLGQQGTSSGTSTQTPAQASLLQQILGGALGGAGILTGMTGTGGLLSGWNPFGSRASSGTGGSSY